MIISNNDELNDFCKSLLDDVSSINENERFITIDTEFIREHLDTPLLCLIQIASEKQYAIVDALSVKDLSPISKIFSDENILKVFHACDQDLDVLTRYGMKLKNVYDTQLAEQAISSAKIANYESLAKKYADVSIEKLYRTSDWRLRPISNAQAEYALDDVIHLRAIYKKQIQKLKDLNREHWIRSEIENKLSFYSNNKGDILSPFACNMWILDESSIVFLKKMAEWRAKKALKLKIPEHAVIKNDVIFSIAKHGINRIKQMKQSRFYNNDKVIKEFLIFSNKICKKLGIKIQNQENTEKISDTASFLKLLLDFCSTKYYVNKNLIADNEDIMYISANANNARNELHAKIFSGWRYEVFGKYVIDAVNGHISIKLNCNTLEIINNNEK